MRIADILDKSCVVADIKGKTKKEIITQLVQPLKKAKLIADVNSIVEIVLEREKLGSTGIGDGVAIPHGKLKDIDTILCAVGRSAEGVDFDAVDRKPVHIFFLVLAPDGSAGLHLKVLSRISKILRDPSFRKKILKLDTPQDIYNSVIEEDDKFS